MSDQAKDREKLWDGVPFKEALQDAVSSAMTGYRYKYLVEQAKNEENEDGFDSDDVADVDKSVNLLAHLFTFYGTKRLADDFDKLKMNEQMYVVGGIIHRFTAGMPSGAGFANVNMENSAWHCLLVKKDAGYEKEVNALIAASEED